MRCLAAVLFVVAVGSGCSYDTVLLRRDKDRRFAETTVPVLVLSVPKDGDLDRRLLGWGSLSSDELRSEIRDLMARAGAFRTLLAGVTEKAVSVAIPGRDPEEVHRIEMRRHGSGARALWLVANMLTAKKSVNHCWRTDDEDRSTFRVWVRPDGLFAADGDR